jgi:uncharacterized membrane protein
MNLKVASSYFLGIVFILVGMAHFFATEKMMFFLPTWMPMKHFCVVASGVVEVLLGAGLFIPRFRSLAAGGVLVLLILYIPLHIIDLNRYAPVIGSKALAWMRLPAQVIMILMAYLATQWEKR